MSFDGDNISRYMADLILKAAKRRWAVLMSLGVYGQANRNIDWLTAPDFAMIPFAWLRVKKTQADVFGFCYRREIEMAINRECWDTFCDCDVPIRPAILRHLVQRLARNVGIDRLRDRRERKAPMSFRTRASDFVQVSVPSRNLAGKTYVRPRDKN